MNDADAFFDEYPAAVAETARALRGHDPRCHTGSRRDRRSGPTGPWATASEPATRASSARSFPARQASSSASSTRDAAGPGETPRGCRQEAQLRRRQGRDGREESRAQGAAEVRPHGVDPGWAGPTDDGPGGEGCRVPRNGKDLPARLTGRRMLEQCDASQEFNRDFASLLRQIRARLEEKGVQASDVRMWPECPDTSVPTGSVSRFRRP